MDSRVEWMLGRVRSDLAGVTTESTEELLKSEENVHTILSVFEPAESTCDVELCITFIARQGDTLRDVSSTAERIGSNNTAARGRTRRTNSPEAGTNRGAVGRHAALAVQRLHVSTSPLQNSNVTNSSYHTADHTRCLFFVRTHTAPLTADEAKDWRTNSANPIHTLFETTSMPVPSLQTFHLLLTRVFQPMVSGMETMSNKRKTLCAANVSSYAENEVHAVRDGQAALLVPQRAGTAELGAKGAGEVDGYSLNAQIHAATTGTATTQSIGSNRHLYSEILSWVSRLDTQLRGFSSQVSAERQLPIAQNLMNLNCTGADIKLALANEDLVRQVNLTVAQWQSEINYAMALDPHKEGPLGEIEYWREKYSTISALYEQINSPQAKFVLQIAKASDCESSSIISSTLQQFYHQYAEAKDNVKFLGTLDRHFRIVQNLDAKSATTLQPIIDTLSSMMMALRMVWIISRFYSTEERMAGLLEKIAHLIAQKVSDFVDFRTILNLPTAEAKAKVTEGQQCLLKWKSAYTNVQEEINSTEREQHWNFDTRRLFGTTDYMSERCSDLLEIIETVEYYVTVLGGQLKTILTDTSDIERILHNVEKLKRPFEMLTFDPFEKKAIHNWQVVFSNFISNVGTLDLKVSHFINNIFDDDLRSSESAFELLLSFKSIENRPERAGNSFDISALLSEKADRILAQYYNEIENVRNIFLEYRDEPPLTKNQPPVAGSIHWCMSLFQRLKHPIVRFQKEGILNTPMGKQVRGSYVMVARQMKDYATTRFLRWREEIQVTATTSLKINIIRKDANGIYVVNFDMNVFDMIREAKYLDRLGFDIPQEALHITLQHEAYHGYVDALKVMLLSFNYELGILNGPERAILGHNIRELKVALEPGFHDINWTSLSIPDFVQNCEKAITKFRNLSREVRKSADSIQTQVVNKIATTRFTPEYKDILQAGGELPELHTFVEIVEQRRSDLLDRCLRAYRTAKPLLTKVESQLFGTHTGKSAELASYYAYWEQRIWRALIKMVLLSLAGFAKLLGYTTSRRPATRPPLFKVVIFLTTEPAHTPQQQEILTAFHKIQLSFIESTRAFPRWMRGTCIEFTHGEIIPRPAEGDYSTLFSYYQDIYNLPQVYRLQAMINRTIQTHLSALATNIKSLQRYRFVYLADKKISVEQQAKSQLHWIDYDAKFQLYFNMINDFDADNHVHNFGFMRCDETPFYAEIVEHVYQWIAMEGAQLNDTLRVRMNKRLARIRAIHSDLARPCDDIDDLKFVLTVMQTAKETALETEQDIEEINYVYDSLRHFGVALDPDEWNKALSLRDVWACVLARVHQTGVDLEPRKLQFRSLTQDEMTRFAAECDRTRAAFQAHGPGRRGVDLTEGEALRKEWRKRVTELQLRRDQLTKAEKLFDLPITLHNTLQELNEELGRVEVVYDLYNQWTSTLRRWNRSSWKDLLLEDLEQTTDERIRQVRVLGKTYSQVEPFAAVEQLILDFHNSLPLLMKLKSPALKARHWEELMHVTEKKLNYEQINLDDLIAMQLFRFEDAIDTIVVAAAREQGVEQEIRSIRDYWGGREFVLVRFEPRRGQVRCDVLTDVSDIQEAVDDNMLKMRSIANVRWAQPFIDEVRLWERRLSTINDVIAVWVTVQQKWQYLESIFKSNDDIAHQLPKETSRFAELDKKFVRIMNDTSAVPNVSNACNTKGRLEELQYLEGRLEECQKDLSNYLETKRFIFPRFYFISDDELLSILASSSAKAVQNHMLKMFDNCARLLFKSEMDETVCGVESQEGERLDFATPVKTDGRAVEEWLQSVLIESQVTLHTILKATVFYYPKMRRLEWLRKYHGMLTLTGAKIFWTFEIEDAFTRVKNGAKNAVKQLSAQLTAQLFDLVGEMDKDIDSQYRKKINTLIIVDVHGRDIVDRFVRDSVMDTEDFDWESQLRFYWQRDGDTCVIRQCTGTFRYGFEYMGLNGRLVITPLTDRCFMTLTQALTFHLGGAPGGPAGTGKTESVKDLAKAMAIQCVVFNCGEGLDYKAMGSIFSGLSQSGSWGCFDEFNRIELPVLSVVSEQLRSIQSALRIGAREFVFTNTVIKLVCTVGVFITMNPGYAGRVELPDNLKALFRPVVMVVPDMELIAENMLFSEGFTTARELAKKMVTLYALARGQLTKQHHYDWGLRALKAVLVMAGQLKRGSPELSEESVLMRALRDMNAPKFIAEDEPLFRGLMEDLFPGLDPTRVPQENLARTAGKVLRERGLQVQARQVDKVVQLYETMQTRHTTMVVGPTGGGKTVVIDTLCRAQTELGLVTRSFVINPKAQSTSLLYGVLDPMTRNWTDGIFSNIFRAINRPHESGANGGGGGGGGGANIHKERRYVIFDGDVDAKWVEDMNSVMDDNKLLTLPNGERIRLHPSCSLLFEVGDLQYASPATVSRVGMVFLDPVNLGWRPFMETWRLSRPRDEHETLDDLVEQFVQPLLNFVLDGIQNSSSSSSTNHDGSSSSSSSQNERSAPLRLIIPTNALNMVKQLTMMVHSITPKDTALEPRRLQCVFVFACVWSFGALISAPEDRARFDRFLKKITGWNLQDVGENFLTRFVGTGSLPQRKTLYDYFFDLRDSRWKPWNVLIRPFTRPAGTPFSALLVSTVDTECNMWLLDKVVRHRTPVMFVGESGTAKTVTIQSYLHMLKQHSRERNEERTEPHGTTSGSGGGGGGQSDGAYRRSSVHAGLAAAAASRTSPRSSVLVLPAAAAAAEVELEEMLLEINFSSRTTSLDAQRAMEDNIEKRTNTVLGPPPKKRLVVFVDDVNMPKVDLYGTQQPIAFLKLLMERNGWYDRKDLLFKQVRDTQFVAAMAPPGGGRNPLDPRFVSLFTVFHILFPQDESVQTIYSQILRDAYRSVGPHAESLTDTLTEMTLRLYRSLVTALPATPAKFHYIFNLRDLSRVYEGLCRASAEKCGSASAIVRLWRNEMTRVFVDRMSDTQDKAFVQAAMRKEVRRYFEQEAAGVLRDPLLFGDFGDYEPFCCEVEGDDGGTAGWGRLYEDLGADYDRARRLVESMLEEINTPVRRMDLVMFDMALEHLLRIARVLSLPRGHCLLIGVGGSGKQSLTRLAAAMAKMGVFELTLSRHYGEEAFREDLKKLYHRVGVRQEAVVFLFMDGHVQQEGFLELIHNMLASGMVPALFDEEEKEPLYASVAAELERRRLAPSKDNAWLVFVTRCRDNLHVVLSMSPSGDTLRTRCRNFPSLINNTTIDWFEKWPAQALRAVGAKVLAEESVPEELRGAIVEHTVHVHLTADDLSARYQAELKRHNYVTPKNFLGYLANYAKLLRRQRDHVDDVVHKFTIGLEKLQLAQNDVTVLQEELAEKEVTLREKQAINARMTREIEAQKSKNEERTVSALAMEEELHGQREEIETESAEAQVVLDQAMPALEEAMEAVKHINPKSITELRSFAKPPVSVVAVVRMVCVVKGVTPTWEAGKIMMGQSDFIRSLVDIDTLTPTLNQTKMNEINKLLREFAINSNDLKKVSVAASGLMIWVEAMKQYWNVAKEVFPKQERVRQLRAAQENAETQLHDCRREIDELTESLRRLERELHAGQQEARQLTQEKAVMERRLNAARRLLDGFASERSRWTAETTALAALRRRLVGDCLAGAAFLSYLGAFTFPYREEAMQRLWLPDLRAKRVPLSGDFDIRTLLADEVTIAQWASDGLPSDQLSVQNGILTTMSTDNTVPTSSHTTSNDSAHGVTTTTRTNAATDTRDNHQPHGPAPAHGGGGKRVGKVRFPLCIDPQMQAVSWIKRRHQDNPRFEVASFADGDFLKRLEFAIQYGNPFLFEGVDEFIDPIIDPVLDPQFKTASGQRIIRVGDKDIPWDDNFRLYLCTKLPNPNYPAEVFGKTMVINYGVTQDGLEAQLLNYVVASERGDLQRQSEELVRTMAESRAQLKELENTLIRELTLSTGNILDNDDLVTTLENTKSSASAVQQKLDEARRTAAITELSRQQYRPAAQRGAVLYFLIAQLSTVNAMYEYSLSAFLHDVFAYSITKSDASFDIADRLRNIIHAVTYNLYAYVCMGIFERDKLMLSFQMAIRLLTQQGRLVQTELAFFLRGCVLASRSFPSKPVSWLTERQWNDVCQLAMQVPVFAELPESVRTQPDAWHEWFALDRPEEVSQARRLLPPPYGQRWGEVSVGERRNSRPGSSEADVGLRTDDNDNDDDDHTGHGGSALSEFQRLCLLRCFRADRVYTAVSNFITHCDLLGEAYVMPPILRYKDVLVKSSAVSPIVCIVSPGANPTDEIVKLASKEVGLDKLHSISLGQGQGEEAMRMVEVGAVRGHWVLLQNCHLLTSWMKELEKTTERMTTQQQPPHDQFRLWLTTEPSAQFPMGILQRSLKVVNEPPNGLKMNMKNTLSKVAEEQLESCPHWAFRPLVFSLAFFHAVVQERRKYGKMGWNVVYDFNETDFTISMRLLNTYLTMAHGHHRAIPWDTLRYLVGEAMYGGRVTDSMDRRIVKTYLDEYFGDFLFDTFRPFHFFVDADVDYCLPPGSADPTRRVTLNQMLAHVERFPNINTPDVFGLHPNAETGYLRQATDNLWASLVELMPRSGGGRAAAATAAAAAATSPATNAATTDEGAQAVDSPSFPSLSSPTTAEEERPTTPVAPAATTSPTTVAPSILNDSGERQLMRLIEDILAQVPPLFDLRRTMQQQRERAAEAGYTSIQPTQVVLMQELERWNLLTQTMIASLSELQKALVGVVGMSGELDELASALRNGQLPHSWRRRAPATRKSLGRWLAHFEQRYAQYRAWCEHGEPVSVWLSGLMVPESYLSALVQVTCRKHGWPLDRSSVVTTVTSFASPAEVREKPEDGAYVHGLFLEGARWDTQRRELAPQRKKELTSPMPVMHIVPTESSRVKSVGTYKTPVYVTSDRRNAAGVGLVFMADLSNSAHPSLWTLESVALILDSDD